MLVPYSEAFFYLGRWICGVRSLVMYRTVFEDSLFGNLAKRTGLGRFKDERMPFPQEDVEKYLQSFLSAAKLMGLNSVVAQVERIQNLMAGPYKFEQLEQATAELDNRIQDALTNEWFLHVTPTLVPYYQDQKLFGADVELKFPTMSEDIAEAGKCLALGRHTAVVFHLMRVMEIAVQDFGDKLGIALVSEKNWHTILEEVNKAIKGLDQKSPQTKAYAEASAHLYNVKLCWRNEVMHPKQTYTEEEARAIFSAVETFICDLAGVL